MYLTLILSFSLIFQEALRPQSVLAYFTQVAQSASVSWQISTWVNEPAQVSFLIGKEKRKLEEKVWNGDFSRQLDGWQIQGSVKLTSQQPCGGNQQQTYVQLGSSLADVPTLLESNSLSKSLPSFDSDGWIQIIYCMVSYETEALLDEPSLTILLNDEVVWQDAPLIRPENETEPYVSEWKSILIPVAASPDSGKLVLKAGNTFDTTKPTYVFIQKLTSLALPVQAGDQITVENLSHKEGDITILNQGKTVYRAGISSGSPELVVPVELLELQPGSNCILALINQVSFEEQAVEFCLDFSPSQPQQIVSLWVEQSPNDNLAVLHFTAPSDGLGARVARYQVLARTSTGQQTTERIEQHSFTWDGPRLPGSIEYISVQTGVAQALAVEVIDQRGLRSQSEWVSLENL